MVTSRASTVEDYIAQLPPDRRETISAVREVVMRNLPKGYTEQMGWGGIAYVIPLEKYPDTHNGQPLAIAALIAQKNYCSLYLMGPYGEPKLRTWLEKEFKKRGKRLDMGKACLRFKTLDDVPLDVIAEAVTKVTPAQYIKVVEARKPPITKSR